MERRRPLKDIIKDMAKISIPLYLVGVVFTAIGYGIYLLNIKLPNIKELLWEAIYKFITDICSTPLGMIFVMPAIVVLGTIALALIIEFYMRVLADDDFIAQIHAQDVIDRQRRMRGE